MGDGFLAPRLHWFTPVIAGLTLFGFLWTAGCGGPSGPERAEVFGTVTFDGEPISQGSISFLPQEGTNGPSAGGLIVDGKYDVSERGPALGSYRVEIQSSRKTGKKIEAGPPSPPGTMIDEIEMYIPTKYNRESGLTVEVKSGRNEFNFKLEP